MITFNRPTKGDLQAAASAVLFVLGAMFLFSLTTETPSLALSEMSLSLLLLKTLLIVLSLLSITATLYFGAVALNVTREIGRAYVVPVYRSDGVSFLVTKSTDLAWSAWAGVRIIARGVLSGAHNIVATRLKGSGSSTGNIPA